MRSFLAVLLLFGLALQPARSQVPMSQLPITNSSILSLAQAGNTLYLGGNFTYVGPNTPYGGALSIASGQPDLSFAKPNNSVFAAVSDGQGGWYLGGNFTQVGGQPRNYLAHLKADGTVSNWNPGASGTVRTLLVYNNTVYAGGDFSQVGGQARTQLAAIDATTGTVLSWDPGANSTVYALAANNSTVYAGGAFTTIGGQTRSYFAGFPVLTPLPVKLGRFTATPTSQGGVQLSWTTVMEQNSDYFLVERSADGRQFHSLGRQAAAGESSLPRNYSYIDPAPLSGMNYYRLLQVDRDGRKEYFMVVPVRMGQSAGSAKLYPNPAAGSSLTLELELARPQQVRYQIIGAQGQVHGGETLSLPAGRHRLAIPVQTLSPGVYSLQLEGVLHHPLPFVKQ